MKNQAAVVQGLGTAELKSGIDRVLQSQVGAFEATNTWLVQQLCLTATPLHLQSLEALQGYRTVDCFGLYECACC